MEQTGTMDTQHYCTMSKTMNLRLLSGAFDGPFNRDQTLQQQWLCRDCGKTEWKNVECVRESTVSPIPQTKG